MDVGGGLPVAERAAPSSRPKDRRAQILVGASELFADRGFAAVSVQEIGERTGISGGAIYRHFPSKDAVLQSLLLDTIEMQVVALEDARREAAELGRPVLEHLVEHSLRFVVDHGGRIATSLRERHRAEPEVREQLAAREALLGRRWSEAILERRPELTRGEVTARRQAAVGVISALDRTPSLLASDHRRALVAQSMTAVCAAPPAAEVASVAPRASGWSAPVTRRQEIFDVALALFHERGFHGVGLNEVGEVLGISGPSIYEYFSAKGDILLDAYDQAGALVVAGMAAALDAASGAAEALDGVIASFVQVCYDHVDVISVTWREGSSLPEAERPRLARRRRHIHETWCALVRELRPELSFVDARFLVRSAFPLAHHLARMPVSSRPAVGVAASLVRTFLTPDGSSTHRTHKEKQ